MILRKVRFDNLAWMANHRFTPEELVKLKRSIRASPPPHESWGDTLLDWARTPPQDRLVFAFSYMTPAPVWAKYRRAMLKERRSMLYRIKRWLLGTV